MNRPSAIDAPVELNELLTSADVEEVVQSCARLHSKGIAVFDQQGQPLARVDTAVGAGWATSAWPKDYALGPDGDWYHKQPLVHDGLPVGLIVVGPTSDERAAQALARHVAQMLAVMIHSAYARYLTGVVHVATMDQALTELEEKNERLLKAVERMQELDNLKTRFLATISHELRTPLTSVIGYSEMMLGGLAGTLNEDQKDYVQTIFDKAEHLLQLITKILDVSQIDAGEMVLARSPILLAQVIQGVATDLRGQASQRKVTIVTPRDECPRVLGDSEKVRRIVWQLVANAIKFSHIGGRVVIGLDIGPLAPQKHANRFGAPQVSEKLGVRISVRDEGIGISRGAQERVFEPFFQEDSSSTRQYGGTGLGLTLAKRYTEAHGGHVWVESALGAGSAFYVTLPVILEELMQNQPIDAGNSEHIDDTTAASESNKA